MAMKRSLAVFTRLSPWSVAIGSVFTLFLVACGDSGSSSDSPEKVVLVSSIDELDDCSEYLEGDTVFVKNEKSNFACVKGKWLNVDSLAAIQNSTNPEGFGSSFVYEQDSDAYVLPPIVQIKNKSISGVSQKGPFVTGATVKLYELEGKTYASTGKSFPSKIASDDGKFSVSSINLASQYALLEATGYFRNEVTGEKSQGTITLNALTDLSDRKTVNINLLTHLEYDRVLHLVGTGINVRSAKKQAEAEILNAFGIRGKFVNSEDLDIFSKGDGNAALLAFSILLLGDIDEDEESNEAELTERLTKFATDIEKDGNWNDEKTKAKIADWASSHFYPRDIRENIEDWELGGSIPDFEKYVRNFWYTTYGLGDCGTQNNGVVAPIKNKYSRYSKENEESSYGERQYICKNGEWKWATPLDIDSYKTKTPAKPKDGDLWTGPVTGNIYTYDTDAGGWVIASFIYVQDDGDLTPVSPAEFNLSGCTLRRNGEVAKASDGVYYTCRTDNYNGGCWWNDYTNMQQCKSASDSCYSLCTWYRWQEASEIEYDTYGKPCTSKEVGTTIYGAVTTTNKYECKKKEYGSSDYGWELVYDQYMEDVRRISEEVESPMDGEIRSGWDTRYKYDEELGKWEITNERERYSDFGGCTTKRIGELAKFCEGDCSYYICGNVTNSDCNHDFLCSAHDWNPVKAIELDTLGWGKSKDGDLQKGRTDNIYKYDETLNKWVPATYNDTTLNLMGCTAKRVGEVGKSSYDNNYYVCKKQECWSLECETEGALYYVWQGASEMESDTYGEKCGSANVGRVINGVVTATNKYYCSTDGWVSLMNGWSWDIPKEARLNPDITYGTMTDSRDQKVYKTVKIGEQTWMAENLNYSDSVKTPNIKGNSWCYDNKEEYCAVTGRLYTSGAVTDDVECVPIANGEMCEFPEKIQGICPVGWHLPTSEEWEALFTAVGGSNTAGKALKSASGWNEDYNSCCEYCEGCYDNNFNGTDAYGFSALPAGLGYAGGGFVGAGRTDNGAGTSIAQTHFWRWSGGYYGDNVLVVNLYAEYDDVDYYWDDKSNYAFSVRCIKDTN